MGNRLVVTDIGTEHYFHRQTGEIFIHCYSKTGSMSDVFCITDDAKGPFCVISDMSNQRHLIYVDDKNRLLYAIGKNCEWKKYTLSALNHSIHPRNMEIFPVHGRLNLIYSAEYDGKCVLVHCILGNHAKPHIIDTASSDRFWIYDKKAYYTNSHGDIGYADLSDEKPDTFCKICENGDNISVYNYSGKEFFLHTRECRLFVNSKELVYDSRIGIPVLTASRGKLYLMWKSGGYVRYITSKDGGETWDNPMRFMTNGAAIETFTMQKCGNSYMFYGYTSPCELHLFSRPDIFRI